MSEKLRVQILLWLEQHSRTGSSRFVTDTEVSEATGIPIQEIRRQMDILESQQLTVTANTHDGRRARISPKGTLVAEGLMEAPSQSKKRPIGFKPHDSE